MSQEERRTSSGRREQPRERTQREQRPRKKRKKGFNLMGTLLYVAFVIGVSTLLAAVGWVAANDLLALNKAEHSAIITLPDDIFTSREVTVETEDGTETETELVVDLDYVIDTLKENGIIEYGLLFRLYSIFSDAQVKMTPGTYQLDTDMDYRAIVTNLGSNSASRQQVTVTIPEGFTVAQIFQRLEDEGVSTVEKLNEMAATHDYAFSFLQEIPLGEPTRLEGYLFPDTYDFYKGEEIDSVVGKLVYNFQNRTAGLEERIAASGMTLDQIVTMASIIQREAANTQDMANVSAVLHNRLDFGGEYGIYRLECDSTIYYPYQRAEDVPETGALSYGNYDTYEVQGLPAGAICNPGLDAIEAALNPNTEGDAANYLYFCHAADGTAYYATNADDHAYNLQLAGLTE